MGIVNVTLDSFSDGGVNFRTEDAVDSARRMVGEGQRSSTSAGVDPTRVRGRVLDEELRRVVPVLENLAGLPVSIDTAKAEVARRALELGAEMVNDVTALRADPARRGRRRGGCLCLPDAHAGRARTMQANPTYDDVVSDVKRFLEERAVAVDSGIREDRICIGSGKTVEHNFELIRRSTRSPRSAGRSSSGSRARARSARSSATPTHHRSALGQHRGGGDRLRAWCDDPSRARREGARGRCTAQAVVG